MGRRRLRALGAWFICSAVIWNVVFDRGVQSAEKRYLDTPRAVVAPEGGIRARMQPAITRSAKAATTWAGALFLPGALAIVFVRRRRPPSASQPSAKADHEPSAVNG